MKQGIIYIIFSKITGFFYIGKSLSFQSRISKHKSAIEGGTHCNWRMQLFLKPTEKHELQHEVLEVCSANDLADRERHWISKYSKWPNCLNIASKGKRPVKTAEDKRILRELKEARIRDRLILHKSLEEKLRAKFGPQHI